ncbi:MAG: ATP-binding protein [bacterium]
MRHLKSAAVFVSVLLLFIFHACQSSPENQSAEFRLKPYWERIRFAIAPIDVDGDGVDELFMDHGEQIDICDAKGTNILISFIKIDANFAAAWPVATGSLDSIDILIQRRTGQKVSFDRWRVGPALEQPRIDSSFLEFSGRDVDGNGKLHLSIYPQEHIIDKSGNRLTILALNSGKDGVRRGILALNSRTGKVAWQFLLGPQIYNVVLEDVDGDGIREIALGTYAPDNSVEWNRIRDDSSYVLLLDAEGRLLWKRPIGGIFTGGYVDIGDMNGDGIKEVVAYRFSIQESAEKQDEIMLLSTADGALREKRRFGKWFTGNALAKLRLIGDLDRDGQADFVVGNTDGIVRLIDGSLDVIATSEQYASRVVVRALADLDGDRLDEVICETADGYLHILNNHLQPLLSEKLPLGNSVRIVRGKTKDFLLKRSSLSSSDRSYAFVLYEFGKIPLSTQVLKGEKPYLLWLLGSFLFASLLVYARGLFYGSYGRRLLLSLLDNAGMLDKILILRSSGQVERFGKQWSATFEVSEHVPRGKKYTEVFDAKKQAHLLAELHALLPKKRFVQNRELSYGTAQDKKRLKLVSFYVPFVRYHFVQLTDLVEQEYLHQVKSWAPVAQRMAHGIKNPLTSVKLNTEELRHLIHTKYRFPDKELDDYFAAILSQVNKLTRISDRFMRFVQLERPDLKPVELNTLIQNLVSQWLPEKKNEIKLEYQLEEGLPSALVDAGQFEFVLKTVFFNALESIEQRGRIQISTALVEVFPEARHQAGTKFIELQVRDTGCGIPNEILHKVGEPYLTNKPGGTGLGLSIVKKIMQDHDGTFGIDSEEGIGTVVTLRLRPAN